MKDATVLILGSNPFFQEGHEQNNWQKIIGWIQKKNWMTEYQMVVFQQCSFSDFDVKGSEYTTPKRCYFDNGD